MIVVFDPHCLHSRAITIRCQQLLCDVKKHVIFYDYYSRLVILLALLFRAARYGILSEITDQETRDMPNINGFFYILTTYLHQNNHSISLQRFWIKARTVPYLYNNSVSKEVLCDTKKLTIFQRVWF